MSLSISAHDRGHGSVGSPPLGFVSSTQSVPEWLNPSMAGAGWRVTEVVCGGTHSAALLERVKDSEALDRTMREELRDAATATKGAPN